MNIPNILTLARIAFIPLLVVLFYLPFSWSMPVAAGLFGLASITDWLDGYLARRWNQSTPFGAFLDPVADKLMVVVALALLIERYDTLVLTLPALVIIGREIVISALREWMAEMGKRGMVAVSWVGKLKNDPADGVATDLASASADTRICPARRCSPVYRRHSNAVVDGSVPESGLAAS